MEQRKNRESHSFTWGMLVGGALVLMLTSKKGRQVLKEVTDGGIEGLEEFIDIDKVRELTKEFSANDEEKDTALHVDQDPQPQVKKPQKRRFFRGARK